MGYQPKAWMRTRWPGMQLAVIVVLGCPGWFAPLGWTAEGLDGQGEGTAQLVRLCGQQVNDAKFACYEQALLKTLRASGVRSAMDTLAAAAEVDRDVQRDGHVHAHAIGIAAYETGQDVARTFGNCTELFQSGCYHGVIQAYLEDVLDPTMAEDATRLDAICQTYRNDPSSHWLLFQCLHAMGHGLTAFYEHDLPRALQTCEALSDDWDQHSCYGGAFMENVVHATRPHHPSHQHKAVHSAMPRRTQFAPLKATDPLHPCSVLQEKYWVDCYQMQTSIILYHNGGDIRGAAAVCDRAPVTMRPWCYQSLGRDISSYTLQQAEEAIRLCSLGYPQYQPWCYVGLVKNFIDLTAKSESGLSFCPRVPGRVNQLKCYEAVGEEIWALTSHDSQRAGLCSSVNGENREACRYGARLRQDMPPGIPVANQ
jgi:hypothetical protein